MSRSTELVARDASAEPGARRVSVAGVAKKAGILAVAAGLVGGVALPAVALGGESAADGQLQSLYADSAQGGDEVHGHTVDFTADQIVATTQAELDAYLEEVRIAEEEAAVEAAAEEAAAQEAAGAAANSGAPAEADGETHSAVSGGNDIVVQAALAQLGVNQDCFSLMRKSVAAAGISINSYADVFALRQVPMSEAKPGDILYYSNGGRGLQHVAIYLGNGQAVHGGWFGSNTVVATAYVGSGPIAYALP